MRLAWMAGAITLMVCVTGLTVATVYLNSTSFRHKLLGHINNALDGTLTMAHHDFSLVSSAIVLSDVVLSGPDGNQLIALDHLRISLFWPALVWHEIRIGTLAIENLRLRLVFDQHDRLQLAQVFPQSGEPARARPEKKLWQVKVDNFHLDSQVIEIQRPAKKWSGRAEQIEIRAFVNLLQRSGQVNLGVDRLVWKTQDQGHTLESITVEAANRPNEARPLTLKIKADVSSLSIQGHVDWAAQNPQLDLSYAFDLALAQIQALVPNDLGLQGSAKGQGIVRGKPDDPNGTLNLEITGAQVAQVPVSRLDLDLTLDQRRVTLSAIHAQSPWGDVNLAGRIDMQPMFADNWFKATAGPESLGYDLTLSGRNIQPHQLPGIAFPWEGRWQLDARVAGTGFLGPKGGGQGALSLKTQGAKAQAVAPVMDGDLSAELQWVGQVIDISKFTSNVGANELSARGRIDLQARRMEAQGALEMARLGDLGKLLDVKTPAGQGRLKFNAQGDLMRPTVQAELLVREVTLEEWTFGQLLAEAELTPDGMVRLPHLVLENQGTLLEGQGALALRGSDGSLRADPTITLELGIEQLELSDFGPMEVLQGHLNGRIKIDGTMQDPVVDLDLSESPLGWKELECHAQGKARWAQGRLTIPKLRLFKGESDLFLKGSAQWRDVSSGQWLTDPRIDAELKTDALDLGDFQENYSGVIRLQADVSGPLSRIQGSFFLESTDLDLGVQKLDALRLEGSLAENAIQVDNLTLALGPGQEIRGRGWYNFDQRLEMTLKGEGIGLAHIAALQQAYPVDGKLNLNIRAGGSIPKLDLSADLVVVEPRIDDQPLDDFHLRLGIREHQLDLDADLNFKVKARGRLDSGDFNLLASFNQSDLTPYLALWGGSQWAGQLSGDLQAVGNWQQPKKIRANAALLDAALSYQTVPLISADRLDFKMQDGVLDLPGTRFQVMQDGHLTVKASGQIDGRLTAEADGRLPLAALAPFTDKVADATGDVQINAQAGGTFSEMQWHADLNLAEIGFALPGSTQSIQDLNGHLIVSPQALKVESLNGTMDGGSFSLDGQVQLKAFQPAQGDLNFKARALPIQWPGTLDLVVNGDLNLKGQGRSAELSGDLVLVEGTYYKDVKLNLLSAFTQTQRGQSVPSTYTPPQWMEAVGLGVTIGYLNPFLVDNNLASLQVVPDLKVGGTLARPVLRGRAEVSEGEVIFRRKSFAVKRGVVDFVNPHKIEPTLDIMSETKIRQWLVSLNVSGTPDQLAFTLSSDPPEADNDILSLILLGRTNSELIQGEGGSTQTTTQMLAALVATAWGEDVRKTTGMDILEVETGALDDEDSQDRVQITVGKKLSRRLTLKYAVESNNGEMVQRAISEYRFSEHVLASGFQDSKGDYGGELLFRIEFQ